MPARIDVDFARRRFRFPVLGILVLASGVAAVLVTLADYRDTSIEAELVSMRLARAERTIPATDVAESESTMELVSQATAELSTPWSMLLDDLETAAVDEAKDVALLEISPNRDARSVRIAGEARSLAAAVGYMNRLQQANSIQYPLLENHEILAKDHERPIHFVIVADWRGAL